MKHEDVVVAALSNRSYVYTFLWRVFAAEPDESFLNITGSEELLTEFELFLGKDSPAFDDLNFAIEQVRDTPNALELLKSDYTKLFVGPGKLPAPPWESVYVSGEDLLFQPSTLEVRQAYRRAGYKAAGYPHEADDHIATEFGFMEALANRTKEAYENGCEEQVRLHIAHQTRFLSEHINVWLPLFTDRLLASEKPRTTKFYRHLTIVAQEVCKSDSMVLEEVATSISKGL